MPKAPGPGGGKKRKVKEPGKSWDARIVAPGGNLRVCLIVKDYSDACGVNLTPQEAAELGRFLVNAAFKIWDFKDKKAKG